MRRILGVTLSVLGIILVGVGLAGTVLVGSDETYDSPATTVGGSDTVAVRSLAGILAYRDATLLLRGTNPRGEVFLGQANPIDVGSYLSGQPHEGVTAMSPSGLTTEATAGAEDVKAPVDPRTVAMWSAQQSGPGEQTLEVHLDGSPTDFVVMPLGAVGPVSVRTGLVLHGIWSLTLGALATGAVVLVIGLALVWRGRSRRAAAAVAAGALVASVSGCSMMPQTAPAWRPEDVRRVAMTEADLAPALADYDRRNNAAIAKTRATKRPDAWATADADLLLDVDRFSSAADAVNGTSGPAVTLTHRGLRLYAPEYAAYPMVTLAAAEVTSRADKEPSTSLVVLRRTSVTAPWLQTASIHLEASALPAPAAPGAASVPTDDQRKQAVAAAEQVRSYLAIGKKPTKVTPDKVLTSLSQGIFPKDGWGRVSMTATFYRSPKDLTGPDGPVQVVRLADGSALAVVSLIQVQSMTMFGGQTRAWKNKQIAKALHQEGDRSMLSMQYGVMTALLIDGSGSAKVIGTDAHIIVQ